MNMYRSRLTLIGFATLFMVACHHPSHQSPNPNTTMTNSELISADDTASSKAMSSKHINHVLPDSTSRIEGSNETLKTTLRRFSDGHALGTLTLTPVANGAHIYGELSGLEPRHTHAIHIHEHGNCDAKGTLAGEHFNPTHQPHGHPMSHRRHAGGLPNITTNAKGIAVLDFVNDAISTNLQAFNSVYQRSIILHAGADNYQPKPVQQSSTTHSGNHPASFKMSNPDDERIACGVIE